ncbi:glycerophosphodiester phosphodiesterase [Thalassiella azotivora]
MVVVRELGDLLRPGRPVVIGHRGASGYRPEHTLASYELAARTGADFLEPDVVVTRDGVLVCRHENDISATTDVADRPELAHLRTTKVVDGVRTTGWFVEDLTLAEVRSLRAVERLPGLRQGNTLYDGRFGVPTLQEVVDLAQRLGRELGRTVGVYPETKHPSHFAARGLDPVPLLAALLRRNGWDDPQAPVVVQSFEPTSLLSLRRRHRVPVPTVLLTAAHGSPPDLASAGDPRTWEDLLDARALRRMASWLDGVGPHREQVRSTTADGRLGGPTGLVEVAHDAGLLVHAWTFRAENAFLPADLRRGGAPAAFGHAVEDVLLHLEDGVDGVFTDHPDLGALARDAFLAGERVGTLAVGASCLA